MSAGLEDIARTECSEPPVTAPMSEARHTRPRLAITRQTWVWLHRWAGLAMAAFLTVAGLTGSVIAFQHELDAWLNPDLYRARARGEPLAPSELAVRVERADPRVRVTYLPLRVAAGESALLWSEPRVDPATGRPFEVDYDQVFADPVTGEMLGKRQWGAFSSTEAAQGAQIRSTSCAMSSITCLGVGACPSARRGPRRTGGSRPWRPTSPPTIVGARRKLQFSCWRGMPSSSSAPKARPA